MSERSSYQADPDIARLRREIGADARALTARVDQLEARVSKVEIYIRSDLRSWLIGLAVTAGYGTPFPEPPW